MGRNAIEVPGVGIDDRMPGFVDQRVPGYVVDLVAFQQNRLAHLFEVATEFLYRFLHVGVRTHQLVNALYRVNDGAVVAPAEMVADGFEG